MGVRTRVAHHLLTWPNFQVLVPSKEPTCQGGRRFYSTSPFARVPFWGYPIFEPHPHGHGSKAKFRTPSEHPKPTTKIGPKMGGEFTYPKMGSDWFDPQPMAAECHDTSGGECIRKAFGLSPSGATVDGRNQFHITSGTLVSDDSPVNTSQQWFFMASKWCRI